MSVVLVVLRRRGGAVPACDADHFLYGSGAIYHDGWKASFGYRPEVWELYDVESDPTEVHDMPTSDLEVQRMMRAAGFEDVSISHDPAFGASLPGETART